MIRGSILAIALASTAVAQQPLTFEVARAGPAAGFAKRSEENIVIDRAEKPSEN